MSSAERYGDNEATQLKLSFKNHEMHYLNNSHVSVIVSDLCCIKY